MSSPQHRTRLHEILALKLAGEIGYEQFCEQFEHAYNFETDGESLTAAEDQIFAELFDVVAWFTADENARDEAPAHFTDESAVEEAVKRARKKLEAIASTEGALCKLEEKPDIG